MAAQVFDRQMENLEKRLADTRGIQLEFLPGVRERVRSLCTADLSNGGRGIGNRLETVFLNPLARAIFDQNKRDAVVRVADVHEQDAVYQVQLAP